MTFINKINIAGILSALVGLGNTLIPVLPQAWANLVSALIGIYAMYHTARVVGIARANGIKGI